MSTLQANFEKQFARGPAIQAAFERPAEGFSVTILFGPSGCGKTTILRCLAGLEMPQRGHIHFGGETWLDATAGVHLPPQRRKVGFLFQDYALFPHLTVAANVSYGLPRGKDSTYRVRQLLDMLQISGLETRYPSQLSGGQQQRVALARAVARQPGILLLDEPLSALDTPTGEQLRHNLRKILSEFAVPCFVVTHSRLEALALGDSVIVLESGKILQQGAITDVFSRPANAQVARMVGVETVVPASIICVVDGLATLSVGGIHLTAVAPSDVGREVLLCIRGEDVTIQTGPIDQVSARNRLAGKVTALVPEGPIVRVSLDCGFPLTALITRPAADELGLHVSDEVTAVIKAPAIHLIPRP